LFLGVIKVFHGDIDDVVRVPFARLGDAHGEVVVGSHQAC
jgi:hypothetical protein